jgi:hypothetical protein
MYMLGVVSFKADVSEEHTASIFRVEDGRWQAQLWRYTPGDRTIHNHRVLKL